MLPYGYAKLPVYHYQTFDRFNLQFTYVPINTHPPPPPPPPSHPEGTQAPTEAVGDGAENGVPDPPPGDDPLSDSAGKPIFWTFAPLVILMPGQADQANPDEGTATAPNEPVDGEKAAEDNADAGELALNLDGGQEESLPLAADAPIEPNTEDGPTVDQSADGAPSDLPEDRAESSEPKEAEFPPIDPAAGTVDAVDKEVSELSDECRQTSKLYANL